MYLMFFTDRYEKLVKYFPEVDDYKLYYSQSLYKAALYNDALKACQGIDNPEYGQKVYQGL